MQYSKTYVNGINGAENRVNNEGGKSHEDAACMDEPQGVDLGIQGKSSGLTLVGLPETRLIRGITNHDVFGGSVNRAKIESTIEAYASLVARAFAVVGEAPFWKFVEHPSYAHLTIDGDLATLAWPRHASDGHGWEGIEQETCEFPASLLSMSDAELAKWKASERAAYDEERRQIEAQRARDVEAHERAALDALKQKYEQ